MPSLLWRKGIAQIQYYVNGKPYIKSLRTKDKTVAGKRFREFSARHELGLIGLAVEKAIPSVQNLFDDYLIFASANLKPRTYRSAKQHITDKLAPFFGGMPATDISPKLIEEFVTRLRTWTPVPYHPRTINAHLETLRKILRRAVEHKDLDAMPCQIKMLKVPDSLPRYAYPEEIKQWLSHMDMAHRVRAIVSLMTGISDRDLGYVMQDGVDLHNLLVRYRRPKTTTDIVIPITPTAAKLISVLMKNNPGSWLFAAESSKKAFSLASARVIEHGGRKITPHMLRHSFATWLVSIGVPPNFVQQMMGHKDIKTTMKYVRVMPEHLREAIDRLEGKMIDIDALMALPQLPDRRTTGARWTPDMREAQAERMRGNKIGGKAQKVKRRTGKALSSGKRDGKVE